MGYNLNVLDIPKQIQTCVFDKFDFYSSKTYMVSTNQHIIQICPIKL